MTTKTTWTLVTRLPGEHRIFRDAGGRLALADNSGDTPDTTDDGVLYLDLDRPVQLVSASIAEVFSTSQRLYCKIPLVTSDGTKSSTLGVLEDGPILNSLGMKVEVNAAAQAVLARFKWWLAYDRVFQQEGPVDA